MKAIESWLLLAVLTSPAFAQSTTLTINGVTSTQNGAVTVAPFASRMVVAIEQVGNARGAFAFAAAFAHVDASQGWWLAQAAAYPFVKPWTLVTGIPTSVIEATYQTDIEPDASGSPLVRLDARGRAVLVYQIPGKEHFPPGFTASVFFQAVTRDEGGVSSVSNGIEVVIRAATGSASFTVARGASDTNFEIGTLAFTGDPANAEYTRTHAGPFDPLDLTAVQFSELIRDKDGATGNLSSFEARSRLSVGRYRENPSFTRIILPKSVSADGKAIPARDLLRVLDRGTSSSGFLVVNHGDNPNTPGQRAFLVTGSFKSDPNDALNVEYYQKDVAVAADGWHALVGLKSSSNPTPDQVLVMVLDGTAPFIDPASGQPSAVKDVTPKQDPAWIRIPVRAAMAARDKFYFFAADRETFDSETGKACFWAAADGSAGPVPVSVDPLRKNNQPFRLVDKDSTLVAADGSVCAVTLAYDVNTEDFYAIDSVRSPSHAVNISAWAEKSKIFTSGFATDGTAYTGIATNGRLLSYTREAGSGVQDEYLASTDGSLAGENRRLTSVFSQSGGLKQVRDPVFVGDHDLLFWVGTTSGPFKGDLYRYEIASATYRNLTNTSGEREPPFTKVGNVTPRGQFFTAGQRYLYFIRDGATSKGGRPAANVCGVDTASWSVFDLTGSEFSQGWVRDLQGSIAGGSPKAETWGFVRGVGVLRNLMFFKGSYADQDVLVDDLFLFDLEHPFSALPLTDFHDDSSAIANITPASFGPLVAFSRGSDIASQSVELVDVARFTRTVLDTNRAVQSGGMVFVPPVVDGPDATPAGLSWTVGVNPAENPTLGVQARYLSLEQGAAPVTFPIVGGSELVHWLEVH